MILTYLQLIIKFDIIIQSMQRKHSDSESDSNNQKQKQRKFKKRIKKTKAKEDQEFNQTLKMFKQFINVINRITKRLGFIQAKVSTDRITNIKPELINQYSNSNNSQQQTQNQKKPIPYTYTSPIEQWKNLKYKSQGKQQKNKRNPIKKRSEPTIQLKHEFFLPFELNNENNKLTVFNEYPIIFTYSISQNQTLIEREKSNNSIVFQQSQQ